MLAFTGIHSLDAVISHYTLTKRTFLAGAQCLKRMWWEMYDPSAPETRPSLVSRFRMDEGAKVGVLARTYVPGGRLILHGGRSMNTILDESREALADPSVPAIYECAVMAESTLVFPDILERVPGGFALVEVKSKTSVSQQRDIPDVAIQAHVLRAAGIPIVRCELMHLSRDCVYPDLSNLFARADVTTLVEARLQTLDQELRNQLTTARLPMAPNVTIGPQCKRPDPCPFMDRCWPVAPTDHVSTLYRVTEKSLAEFAASGWQSIRDLPDDVKLGAIAGRQRRALREGHRVVERETLLSAMKTLTYPVAHIDFETIQPAIPVWDGCRPYDQVPVQFSCHLVNADHTEKHTQWLFDGKGDPRPGMAAAILEACKPAATVTAYSAQFERGCIELVAAACPEQAALLKGIADNLVDLQPIVRENVYDEKFGGSFSIKKVVPALVPDLSYDDLPIAEAETASVQLARIILGGSTVHPEEREELRQALLKYGERDTKAMVVLSNRLSELAS
ncbi:MAG: hypothetical protein NVSMB53_03400 [Gemmatimonadaceae bacterium]